MGRGWMVALVLAACTGGGDKIDRELEARMAAEKAVLDMAERERVMKEHQAALQQAERTVQELKALAIELDRTAEQATGLHERLVKATGEAEQVELRRALEETAKRREALQRKRETIDQAPRPTCDPRNDPLCGL